MKKLIALLLVVLMLASLLTACGGKKPEQEDPAVNDDVVGEVQPEVTPEEPEVKPSPNPEKENAPQPEVQPEAKPEVKPEAKPEQQEPATKPEVKPEQEEAPVIGETEIVEDAFSPLAGDLTALMDSLYAAYPNFPAELMLGTIPVDLADADSVSYFTGLSDASKVKEAIVSEPMMGSQPYSVVLVRLNDAADAKAVAEAMRDGIDQRKWVCVEADVLRVVACDDVVLLVMIGSNLDDLSVDTMVETFGGLCGKGFSVDLKK